MSFAQSDSRTSAFDNINITIQRFEGSGLCLINSCRMYIIHRRTGVGCVVEQQIYLLANTETHAQNNKKLRTYPTPSHLPPREINTSTAPATQSYSIRLPGVQSSSSRSQPI